MSFKRRTFQAGGFTLVEILIVVVILGILAAIAVPKLSNASQIAPREFAEARILATSLRTQVNVYRANHQVSPGYPGGDSAQTPTQQAFTDQLTLYTNAVGNTSATRTGPYTLGPYLPEVPQNPDQFPRTTLKLLATLRTRLRRMERRGGCISRRRG